MKPVRPGASDLQMLVQIEKWMAATCELNSDRRMKPRSATATAGRARYRMNRLKSALLGEIADVRSTKAASM